jgi:hypothetical protein
VVEKFFIKHSSLVLMAHTCNPRYSGSRDQEDHGSKPAWAKSLRDPNLKKPITEKNRAGGWDQGVSREFKSQYQKNKAFEQHEEKWPMIMVNFYRE